MRATPAQVGTGQLATSTLCLLNAQRARYRPAPAPAERSRSPQAAQRHASDMERRKYFSHVSRDGSDFVQRIRRTGYFKRASPGSSARTSPGGPGANRSSPRGIVAAWMASPPHRQNILNSRFREIGIGVVVGAPQAERVRPAGRHLRHELRLAAAEPSGPATGVSRRLAPDSRAA